MSCGRNSKKAIQAGTKNGVSSTAGQNGFQIVSEVKGIDDVEQSGSERANGHRPPASRQRLIKQTAVALGLIGAAAGGIVAYQKFLSPYAPRNIARAWEVPEIHPKAVHLVKGLRAAGLQCYRAGDFYARKGVYVQLSRADAVKAMANESQLPKGWVLTYPTFEAFRDVVARKPVDHEQYRQHLLNYFKAMRKKMDKNKYRQWIVATAREHGGSIKKHRVYLARAGGAVSESEAARVVAALTKTSQEGGKS